ncbi:CBS domain-containing protein [Candidatus Harpocratesius sp.]
MTRKPTYGLIAADIAHVGVYLLEKSDSLLDVVSLMDKKMISAVIIEDIDDLSKYYIISHRQIVHFLAQFNKSQNKSNEYSSLERSLAEIKAKELMRGPIPIIQKHTPIDDVVHFMNTKGYKRVVVGNEQSQPIGIISTKDVIAWTTDILPKGKPIMICVQESKTGLILANYLFRDDVAEKYIDLLGGTLSAIEKITDEVLQNSGDLRYIEKDYYDIMFEQNDYITAILVCDESSIELRIELQAFTRRFMELYGAELEMREKTNYTRPVSLFKLRPIISMFE